MDYIKENHCFISLDAEADLAQATTQTHVLPDGTKFDIGSEAFLCAERLFNRSDANSLQKMVVDSLSHFSYYGGDLTSGQKNLLKQIYLAGGNTEFRNFQERLREEMHVLNPALKNNEFAFNSSIIPETVNYK